jgi:hypothetical protein
MSFSTMMKRPSAFLPLVLAGLALATVFGFLALHGVPQTPQPDEGAAAHIWQLTMACQGLAIAFFAVSWLPREPRPALQVLALQALGLLASLAPVYLLHL